MKATCQRCGTCCSYFCFEIDEPESWEMFEDVRWYLCHEGVSVHVDEDGDWYISIMNPCAKLGPDNVCMIYEDRPYICRKYAPDGCDRTGGEYGYQEVFESPEQIDEYARRTLGPKYARQKRRAMAKLEPKKPSRKKAKKAGGAARDGKSAGAAKRSGGKKAAGTAKRGAAKRRGKSTQRRAKGAQSGKSKASRARSGSRRRGRRRRGGSSGK